MKNYFCFSFFFNLIFNIKSIDVFLVNINKMFLMIDIGYISSKIFLIINLVFNLSLLSIFI